MSNQRALTPVPSGCSSSSSSSSTPQRKYEVFLSFRGEDTRNNFTDHLYDALEKRGIVVFRDDEKLERGKAIAPELLKAIEESRFSIVVFSRNYASSRWCLDELVKIVECMREKGQVVLPIFHYVDPSDVRKQTGSFQEAFDKHEEDFREKMQEWRTAMTEVANLSGWHLQDRSEAKLIQDIVKKIWCELSLPLPRIFDGLVGIDSRVEELNACLDEGLSDVRFIGICGMGGIGKTTIASVVYQRLSHQFESSCFLRNVKEVFKNSGLLTLQNQLLSELMEQNINVLNEYRGGDIIRNRLRSKKVLIILDDVDELEQLKMLAEDREWFGSGSRIIITTRDEHLLKAHGVDKIYQAEELNYDESLMLFSWKAFKQNHPAEGYDELSRQAVNYANGLPLALEVLGSSLYGRSVNEWKSALDRLEKYPDRHILDILIVSFDGLEEDHQKIFLDLACFFKWNDRNDVTKILDACGFNSEYGIAVLIDKSLIKMSGNDLWMHDLLEKMGREIVRKECTEEPGKRSRLWAYEDFNHVLTKNTGTDRVEAIVIDLPNPTEAQWDPTSYSKMSKLRLLKIHNVHLYHGPKCLSNELRWLEWHGYPSKCLPLSFHPNKLVELDMSHSQNLIKTPNFTGIPNLESLILNGCTRLCEVHPSIGLHKKLIFVNLRDCKSLRSLPRNIEMESLQIFILSGCSKLRNFPEITGKMECLLALYLDGTAIEDLPSSIERLRGLVLLNLRNCKKLSFHGCEGPSTKSWNLLSSWDPEHKICYRIPDPKSLLLPSLLSLCSIKQLDLSDCNLGEGAIPNDFGCLSSLTHLNLRGNNFVSLPASISRLSQLWNLNVENCNRLQSLPELPSNLQCLWASDCTSLEMLPEPLNQWNKETALSQVREFDFSSCFKLVENQGCNSMATRIMMAYLQGMGNLSNEFHVVIPGNEIPEWFSYQTEGCGELTSFPKEFSPRSQIVSLDCGVTTIPLGFGCYETAGEITIQCSPHSHNSSKLIGFALCCRIYAVDYQPFSRWLGRDENFVEDVKLLCCLLNPDDEPLSTTTLVQVGFSQDVRDHLLLVYVPCRSFCGNDFRCGTDFDKATRIQFAVQTAKAEIKTTHLKVIKFGLRPVYGPSQMNQCSDCFNDLHRDLYGSALEIWMDQHFKVS